jgi:hypothetical protein
MSSSSLQESRRGSYIFASIAEALNGHLADDTLIKGWEVARRTCNGRERGPLRKAAREVNSIRNSVLEGKAAAATNRKYTEAIQALYSELSKAGEQDFDGMLGEALGWLEAQEAADGVGRQRLPVPAALTRDQALALERIREYRFTNSPGHIGRAIDRDLRVATEIAKEVRGGLAAMMAAAPAEGKELAAATQVYVDAADRFCAELKKAGEPDFDGLLRQAVLVLDSAPGKDKKGIVSEFKGGAAAAEVGKSKRGSKGCGKNAKGYGGHREGYASTYFTSSGAAGYHDGKNWDSLGKSETKKRTWYSKEAWPDESSWGA